MSQTKSWGYSIMFNMNQTTLSQLSKGSYTIKLKKTGKLALLLGLEMKLHPLNVDFRCTSIKMIWQDLDICIYICIYYIYVVSDPFGDTIIIGYFSRIRTSSLLYTTINEQLEEVGDDYLSGKHCTCVNMLWDNESILTNWISCHMSLWQAGAATKQLYHWD